MGAVQESQTTSVSADSVAALQVNLAAIQAPPLGAVDQSQSLAAIKSGLLAQLQAVEQRARATSGGQLAVGSGSLPGKALDPAKLLALGKDCLRVVLLSLGFALAFAAAAQRKGTTLSVLAEWSLAAKRVVKACKLWQQQLSTERQQQGSTARAPLNIQARKQGKRSTRAGARSNTRKRGAYADYFETPASEQEDRAGD